MITAELQKIIYPKFYNSDDKVWIIGEFSDHQKKKTFKGLGVIQSPKIKQTYSLFGDWIDNEYKGKTTQQYKFYNAVCQGDEQEIEKIRELLKDIKGLPKNLANQIFEKYENESIQIIKANPYLLTEFRRVGFKLADRAAMHFGINPDCLFRQQACIEYAIKELQKSSGDVWIQIDNCLNFCIQQIGISCKDGIDNLISNNKINCLDEYITNSKDDETEKMIAEKIKELLNDE